MEYAITKGNNYVTFDIPGYLQWFECTIGSEKQFWYVDSKILLDESDFYFLFYL